MANLARVPGIVASRIITTLPLWLCLTGASCDTGSLEAADTSDASAVPGQADAMLGESTGLGYPVGDTTTYPAGGWFVTQVVGHFYGDLGGRHLAQDVAMALSEGDTFGQPVYSIGNGVVRYAGPNGSSYRNVVLIEHELAGGDIVCSFYGHLNEPSVSAGERVGRGQQISTILDWAELGGPSSNSHLHYVVLTKDLCDASAAADGALVCGYDKGGASEVTDLENEPASYQAIDDVCGDSEFGNAFLSPSQLIEANHF